VRAQTKLVHCLEISLTVLNRHYRVELISQLKLYNNSLAHQAYFTVIHKYSVLKNRKNQAHSIDLTNNGILIHDHSQSLHILFTFISS